MAPFWRLWYQIVYMHWQSEMCLNFLWHVEVLWLVECLKAIISIFNHGNTFTQNLFPTHCHTPPWLLGLCCSFPSLNVSLSYLAWWRESKLKPGLDLWWHCSPVKPDFPSFPGHSFPLQRCLRCCASTCVCAAVWWTEAGKWFNWRRKTLPKKTNCQHKALLSWVVRLA